MGIVAIVIALLGFWFFVGKRHALIFAGIVVVGLVSIGKHPDRNHCEGNGRMWVCHNATNLLW